VSTLALEGRSSPAGGRALLALRYADLALLAIALPVFALAGLPLAGYAVLAVAWLVQRSVQVAAQRHAERSLADGVRKNVVGVLAGSVLVRLWIITLSILLVGLLGDREDGLAAAVLAAILVTTSLTGEALTRALEPPEAGP
jgi:hypothetical protein